jgi:hypothetical protein
VDELLSRRWAPLCFEPGLAGREFFFDESSEVFETLAMAFPHLSSSRQERVRAYLRAEWSLHAPLTPAAFYPLDAGERREFHRVPAASRSRASRARLPHPFAGLEAVALYAERVHEEERIGAAWEVVTQSFDDFLGKTAAEGAVDIHANRYLASLVMFERMARARRDETRAEKAAFRAAGLARRLRSLWSVAAARKELPVLPSIREWDAFLSAGDPLFFAIAPHRAKILLFQKISPLVAARLEAIVPTDGETLAAQVERVWTEFESLCPTWHLAGEERQVHYGENFADPPDFSEAAFRALAWLRKAPREELSRRVDVPFCHADLGWMRKLAILLDRE